MGFKETFTGLRQQFVERVGNLQSSIPNAPLSPEAKVVISVLEDPTRSMWKTEDDIAEVTGLDRYDVHVIVISQPLEKIVVRSSRVDEQGRDLFTTRQHYNQRERLSNRLLSALSDRIR